MTKLSLSAPRPVLRLTRLFLLPLAAGCVLTALLAQGPSRTEDEDPKETKQPKRTEEEGPTPPRHKVIPVDDEEPKARPGRTPADAGGDLLSLAKQTRHP